MDFVASGNAFSLSFSVTLFYKRARKGEIKARFRGPDAESSTPVVQCLPPMHKALDLIPHSIQVGTMTHICNPGKWEVETERLRTQGPSRPYRIQGQPVLCKTLSQKEKKRKRPLGHVKNSFRSDPYPPRQPQESKLPFPYVRKDPVVETVDN